MQSQNFIAAHHIRKIIFPLAASTWHTNPRPCRKSSATLCHQPASASAHEDEYEAVLLAADRHRREKKPDARPYTLVYLLLTTGIKKSECLGIHINHIDLDAKNGPHVFIRYASPANRYKERKIDLEEDWITAYKEYLAQYQPVDQVFAWSPRRLEYLLEDIGAEASLTKHLSFDMCRWTCALRDYQAGIEPDKIRQKLGVSKIQWRELFIKIKQLNGEIK